MTTEETLRAAVAASLSARHATEDATIEAVTSDGALPCGAIVSIDGGGSIASTVAHATELAALRALARACGLRDDGSDPIAELARVTAERDAAWAALREYGPTCDGCGRLATRQLLHCGCDRACDRAGCAECALCCGDALTDLLHADALRAAGGAR